MIRQKSIYLKNLILFKLVLYPIILVCYYWLSVVMNQKLKTLNIHNRKVTKELRILQTKYQSTANLASNIHLLSKLPVSTAMQVNMFHLSQACYDIGQKYRLVGLTIHATSPYPSVPTVFSSKLMCIYSHDITIKFYAPDLQSSLLFIEQYCNVLPQYHFIESLDIQSRTSDDVKTIDINEYPIMTTLRIQVEYVNPTKE